APAGNSTATIWRGEGKFGGEMFCRTYPDCGSRQGVRSPERETGLAGAEGSSNNVARETPRPEAIFSSTTAVALISPLSTREIIERLTPHVVASASRVRPACARSAATRVAIRKSIPAAVRAAGASFMLEI